VVRPVAQLASVVGRDFAYDLLRRVAEQDDASLARDLDRLVELNLLTCDGTPPEAVYTFRHALIQDAAYRSLVRGTRQQYHGRVAATLAEHFPQVAGQHPEVLAHHFTEAGRYDAAIPHWVRAGAAAMDRSAEVESIRHLERGIAAAERMAESPERVGRELELQTALGRAWSVYRGFGAPEVERAYTRAHELSSRAGETPQVFQVLLGLYAFYLVRGEFITALQVARRMMRFAERAAHPALLLGGHFAMGMVELWLGEFASSLEHHEQVIALEAQVPRQPASAARVDPGVLARAYAGLAAWHLGRPDTALAFGEQATAVARDLDHSYSEAEANFFNAWLHQLRGDAPRCRESAEAAVRLCRTGGFHFWLEPAAILLAWARARAPEGPGAGEEPAAVIRGAFDKYQAAGSRLAQSHYLTLLVDTLLGAGRPREAAAALREAQDAIRLTGEAPWEPEVQRLEGDVLLAGGEEDRLERAERCFRQALKTAGRQGALGNELRAAMALHRLAREAGRPPEDELLREVVGRFTEGHDTADLVAARRLLEGA